MANVLGEQACRQKNNVQY
ncbi:TPA: hypothetical protein HI075_004649 [Escherichia coli]|nr:hypothetical protein [Escherichia coli]